tara:strand:- start:2174 stop:2494 length:321 start_codon:yes stop_codon:yes gene_type:complete
MEVTGKLVKKLQAEAGTSKAGKSWTSQTCIVETDAEFNNLVAIKCFGDDKIKQMNKLEVGATVNIKCNVYSREYKGKYYHNIDGYWFSNQSNTSEVNEEDSEFMPF